MKETRIPRSAAQVEQKMLKFGAGGPSVEEARAAMIAAKEPVATSSVIRKHGDVKVPKFIAQDTSLTRAQQSAEAYVVPASQPQPQQPQRQPAQEVKPVQQVEAEKGIIPPAAPVSQNTNQKIQKIETDDFTAEVSHDGSQWVAHLVYKNGGGQERWTAKTQMELNLKLLTGKGHATMKVRETNERLKTAAVPDTWNVLYDLIRNTHGISTAEFNALSNQSRLAMQETVEAAQAIEFMKIAPEYYPSAKNEDALLGFIHKSNWPVTIKNLVIAFRELTTERKLETGPSNSAPATTPSPVPTPAPTPVVKTEIPVVPETAPPVAPRPTSVPVVRKRIATGIVPGSSSASSVQVSSYERTQASQEGELSAADARRLPMDQLEQIVKSQRKQPTRTWRG